MCFKKMVWGISEMVSARAFKPLPLCSAPLKLTSRDYWCSRDERKPLSELKHVFKKAVEYLRNMNARAFKPLPLCSAPLKTY